MRTSTVLVYIPDVIDHDVRLKGGYHLGWPEKMQTLFGVLVYIPDLIDYG